MPIIFLILRIVPLFLVSAHRPITVAPVKWLAPNRSQIQRYARISNCKISGRKGHAGSNQ